MSVKLSSPKVELSVLRAALHKDSRVRNGILGKLDSSYFESDESRELFSYIESSLAKTGEAPPFRVLVDDQSLSREARSFMRDSVPNIQSAEDAKKAVAVLSGYRQTRGLYDVVASVSRRLQGSKVNPTSLLREVGDEVGRLQLTKANAASFTHLGVGNNAKAAVHSLIYDESNDVCIPTGIEVFDKESRGFMRGALVTAGATSGGGKSLLANELAVNMALNGYKVVVVPLEMSRDEMLGRIAAKVCGVDSTKIITKQLATGEKKLVEEKMDAFMRKVNKRGGRLTVFKPEGGISIEETYAALASLEADVTIVDYISLLEGVDGDDAWQKLGAIARTAKVNADATNRVNILLCQVNDDGTIRYSRAISEHSSNSWIWRTPLEEREKAVGVVQVSQVKARNSKSFNFEVGMEWAYMRLAKVTQEAVTKAEPKKNLADI